MKQKKLFIFIILILTVNLTVGQKTELKFNTYSGLFSYRGNGSVSKTYSIWSQFDPTVRTGIPYGRNTGFSYALELQLQRISKGNFIYGCGIAFESLQSKLKIDTLYVSGWLLISKTPGNGVAILKNAFITVNPCFGHRYAFHGVGFDLLAEMDIAYCLKSTENVWTISDTKSDPIAQNELAKPTLDFRPRIQLQTQIKRLGLLAGYSLGLTNYQSQNNLNAMSSFIRFGLSYRVK